MGFRPSRTPALIKYSTTVGDGGCCRCITVKFPNTWLLRQSVKPCLPVFHRLKAEVLFSWTRYRVNAPPPPPPHRGRKLLSPCTPASALPDDCLLSGFHVLKITMHNAFCLSQAEIFPLIGLSPPSRALWEGEYFASRGSRSCFLRLRSTKGLSGMGVFKSASVIFVSSYSQVKILLYSLDFLR